MGLITKPFTWSAGAVIIASQHNSVADTLYNEINGLLTNANIDAAAAIAATKLNLATIAQTVGMSAAAINMAKGTDIASATTTDIGAMVGNYGDVTGTVTITGLGTVQAGTQRTVRFTGALTLTHHATSLILPGGIDITTIAGDVATFVSLGSGNWRCTAYQKGWSPSSFPVEGYATGRSIIRSTRIAIDPGATPGTNINVTASAQYNNPTITNATNLAAAGSSGSFALDAGATTLTFNITPDIVGFLSGHISTHDIKNSSTLAADKFYLGIPLVSGGNLSITFYQTGSQSLTNFVTGLVTSTGDQLVIDICYVTST